MFYIYSIFLCTQLYKIILQHSLKPSGNKNTNISLLYIMHGYDEPLTSQYIQGCYLVDYLTNNSEGNLKLFLTFLILRNMEKLQSDSHLII